MRVGTVQGIPHIRAAGSPAERGHQIGSAASERIRNSIANYTETFAHYTGLTWESVCDRAEAFLPEIEAYDPEIAEEMGGIAGGAGVELRDILAVNVRTEVMFGVSAEIQAECTAFGCQQDLNTDGHVVIGQNWDWRPVVRGACILLEVEQPGKPSFITFLEAGLVGKMGFNSAGVGLVTNLLVTDLDRGEPGVPFHVILRGILDASDIQAAIEAITRSRRASSANFLVADETGDVRNLETGPGGSETVYVLSPEGGMLTHANNFVTDLDRVTDLGLGLLPDSPARTERLRKLLLDRGQFGIDALKQVLTDHAGQPDSICRHCNEAAHPIEQLETQASLLIDLTAQELQICVGPPCEGTYTTVATAFAPKTEELQPS